jgi:hypothetical protein
MLWTTAPTLCQLLVGAHFGLHMLHNKLGQGYVQMTKLYH